VAFVVVALNNEPMNAYTRFLVARTLILLAIPMLANSADSTHRCAEQANEAQRLACYDAAFGKPRAAATGSGAVVVAAPAARSPAATTSTAPAVAVVQPAAVVAAPISKNGKPDAEKAEAAPKSTGGASRVASLRRMRDGRYEATLENGDVWGQLEPDARVEMRVGDAVTIRAASLGSFMLVTSSGLPTRVKRVK
jgi:hypothetical protein